MAEISREEAIKYFKKRIEIEKKIVSLPTCDKEVAETKKKHIDIFKQAISDVEKLEKIEKLVQEDYIDNYPVLHSDCGFNHCGGYCVEVRILNDIVKLYKNN